MCSIYWILFSLSWKGENIVPQSVMESVQNSWCSWDCFYSGHCKFLVRAEWMPTSKKKSFWSKCLHQGKCFFQSYSISTAVPTCYRPRARNMRDRKNYTHHTIIMKRKLLYVVPCPSLNIMLVFQACLLLLSAVSSSFPSYPKPNFKSLPLLNRNPSYLLCFYNSITILSSIPFTMAFLHILSLIFSIMEDALTSTKKMSH